jgi:hypothetical protein
MGAGRRAALGIKAYLGIRDVGPINGDDTMFGIDVREHNFIRARTEDRRDADAANAKSATGVATAAQAGAA